MDKSRHRDLKRKVKEGLAKDEYELNLGGIPRVAGAVGLPHSASDSEYLDAIRLIGAEVLFPNEENRIMAIHDRGPEGETLLQVACSWGDLRAVRLLIEAGSEIDSKDEMNVTPLHTAVNGRYLDIVEFLLDRGADRNLKDNFGYSPLELSTQMDYMEIADALRKR